MNKKSFFLGVLTGAVLTFVVLFLFAFISPRLGQTDPIQYLEKPVSYENKESASFNVIQVLSENAALATESFGLTTVVIIGENFYTDQLVTIKKPQRVGTYSYTSRSDMPMTVPVIKGEISNE